MHALIFFYFYLFCVLMFWCFEGFEIAPPKKAISIKIVSTFEVNPQNTTGCDKAWSVNSLTVRPRSHGKITKAMRAINLRQLEQAKVELKHRARDSCWRQILKDCRYEN